LIAKKRDGQRLTSEQLQQFVDGFMQGYVADYQMSAFLMAALLNGLDDRETSALTDIMLHSGSVLALPSVKRYKIDKHSTGGVGDKVSICLAPLVASCGLAVPMISGRGLGHTGGTLDKLEAIKGYNTRLNAQKFERVVREVGASIIGQTPELAPADRRIYALRDVTATVESIPLIVASILSKKLAEGIDGLVLDVKVGRGAFMKTLPEARALARALIRVGKRAGKDVSACITNMDTPLGKTIGNALEVREAIEVVRGEGPADLVEITLALGEQMLLLGGAAKTRAQARALLQRAIDQGQAAQCLARMIAAQGGDGRVVERPQLLPRAPVQRVLHAKKSGRVLDINPLTLGLCAIDLGAGRLRAEQKVDPAVGIELLAQLGDRVKAGQGLMVVHARKEGDAQRALATCIDAFRVGAGPVRKQPLVIERL
jgi:pyrimidine-nucleoside phosphorylase